MDEEPDYLWEYEEEDEKGKVRKFIGTSRLDLEDTYVPNNVNVVECEKCSGKDTCPVFQMKKEEEAEEGELIKLEIPCPFCNYIHVIKTPIDIEFEGGTIKCFCGKIITFIDSTNLEDEKK